MSADAQAARPTRGWLVLGALAFLAFLAWLWFGPRFAHGQVQQVIVTSGCCCGTPDHVVDAHDRTPPPALHTVGRPDAATFGVLTPAAIAATTPRMSTDAARVVGAPAGVAAVATPHAFVAWMPGGIGYAATPCSASSSASDCAFASGSSVAPPPVIVPEPPMWPLFVLAALGIVVVGYGLRRLDQEGRRDDH